MDQETSGQEQDTAVIEKRRQRTYNLGETMSQTMYQIYDATNELLRDAGLISKGVMETVGWQTAVDDVMMYCGTFSTSKALSGPGSNDSWWRWIEIISHELWRATPEGFHNPHDVGHAEIFQQMAKIVINALNSERK